MPPTRDILRPDGDGGRGGIAGFANARGIGAVGSDAFDALADLFLGDIDPSRADAAVTRRESSHRADDMSSLASVDELEMLGVIGARPTADREDAASDELKLARDSRLNAAARSRGRSVELVVAANVPGVAGAWLAQIAAREATRGGVMLLDARATAIRVECFGPRVACARDLEAAIDVGSAACARIMLCAGDAEARDLIGSGRVTRVHLISGADETSVIAAYRGVKSLVLAARRAKVERGCEDVSFGIWFVGCDAAHADAAGVRLRRACEQFLGASIEIEPSVARLGGAGSGGASLVFESEREHAAIEIAEMVAGGTARSRTTDRVDRRATCEPTAQPKDDRFRVGVSERVAVEPPTVDVAPDLSAAVEPRTALAPSARVAGVEAVASLASVIAGLEPLRARCPFANGVELAVDGAGGLHVIAIDDGADAVKSLTVAAAWAGVHRDLLALTTTRAISGATPVLHLLSERPERVRHLLDAEIRVHAMVRATRPGIVALALN